MIQPTDQREETTILEARLEAALEQRDSALGALARERSLVNGMRLRLRHDGEHAHPLPPGSLPLRYEVADRLNDAARKALGPVHSAVRSLLQGREK